MTRARSPVRDWRILAAVAILVVTAVFLFWPSGLGDVRNLDSSGTALVALGDSLTAGYGAPAEAAWPARVETTLGAPIVNAGRNGDTTSGALGRLGDEVLALDPRIVIVGLGGNDYLRNVPIETTEANLRDIVRNSQSAGAMVVLLGFDFPGFRGDYAGMYERIAGEEGALLIPDVLDGILSNPSLRSDAIHPNADGYAVMAERIEDPLRRLISKADAAR